MVTRRRPGRLGGVRCARARAHTSKGRLAIDVGFVGGFGRSGSTLIERVIAAVPGACALGEVRHLWHRGVRDNELCACGNRFHDCPFWTQIGEVAFGGWAHLDVTDVRRLAAEVDRMRRIPTHLRSGRRSTYHRLAREYADYFATVYAAAAAVSGADIVVDSSKNACTAYALTAHEAINLRVLQVVRDSRGVAYSWTKSVARPEAGESADRPLMDQYAPWQSALLWDAHNTALAVLARRGIPSQLVRYEDFVERPVAVTRQLVEFLGLDSATVPSFVTDSAVTVGTNHQVAGNPMRFQTGTIAVRRDDDWREQFPRSSRRLVASLTFPLMARYGYLRRAGAES